MLLETEKVTSKKCSAQPALDLFTTAYPAEARRAKAWLDNRLATGKTSMTVEMMKITPAIAEQMLERCNTNNRPLNQAKVDSYTDQMLRGLWKKTAQTVSISTDSRLNNGQHRLHAIIKSGMPLDMFVVFGEDRDAFLVTDVQRPRSAGDALHIAGFNGVNHLAAAARLAKAITENDWREKFTYTNEEILTFVRLHPEIIDHLKVGSSMARRMRCSHGAIGVACWLLQGSKYAAKGDEFQNAIYTGENMGPVLAKLRDAIVNKTWYQKGRYGNKGSRDSRDINISLIATFVLGWNQFVSGRRGLVAFDWKEFPKAL